MPSALPTFADWFGAELDKKLATLQLREWDEFLTQQRQRWEVRYARFIGSGGETEVHRQHRDYGVPTATDFVLFLCEIDKRQAKIERVHA